MQPTSADVGAFLDAVPNETRRADAKVLCKLFGEITREPPVLWGPTIVGFGTVHYRYASGREGSMPLAGFSPRKAELVVNLMNGFEERDHELMVKLGTYKTGVSKLYIKRLADIDLRLLPSWSSGRCASRAMPILRPGSCGLSRRVPVHRRRPHRQETIHAQRERMHSLADAGDWSESPAARRTSSQCRCARASPGAGRPSLTRDGDQRRRS
jgi:hypothetical protein